MYLPSEWDRLHRALRSFGSHFHNGKDSDYISASAYPPMKPGSFPVQRADRNYFRKDELDAMYWYFAGVLRMLNVDPKP